MTDWDEPTDAKEIALDRSRRNVLFQVLFSAVCLSLLLWLVDLGQVASAISQAAPGLVFLAIVVAFGDRFLMIGKWYPLLIAQVPQIGLGAAARSYFAATFANYLLPSTVGSDALRAAALGRPHGKAMEVGASIVAERLLGMLANGILVLVSALAALSLAAPIGPALVVALGIIGVTIVAVLAPFSGRLRSVARVIFPRRLLGKHNAFLSRFLRAYIDYRRSPRAIGIAALLTLLEVWAPLVITWILTLSLGLKIPFAMLLVCVPVSQLLAKIPISFAGLGIFEGSFVSMLAAFGVAPESALAIAALLRATDIAVSIPGAFMMRDFARGLLPAPANT